MLDPLVVLTEELALVMEEWLYKHNGRYPQMGNIKPNYHYKDKDLVPNATSGYGYILNQMGKSAGYARVLYRIKRRESKHTELRIADAILSAIEEVGALEDGRIEVIPNPLMSMERWLVWKAEQGCI
jgi:hypothetical protein